MQQHALTSSETRLLEQQYVWHVYVSPKTYTWSGTSIIKNGRYTFIYLNTATVWSCMWTETRKCITITEHFTGWNVCIFINTVLVSTTLTLSNPICLPTAYSPALICFRWWITCNYPTVLKEKDMEIQKEYNVRYLLAKDRTTWGKASDRLRQRANKCNKNRVGCLLTSEQNWKIILLDEVRCRIGKG
jgi:hypothetical protein